MDSGGILLCALDRDDRAAALVASARSWAAATGSRVLFVHACAEPADVRAAHADLAAMDIADDELRIVAGDPAAALVRAIGDHDPSVVLVAASASGAPVGSVCGALIRHARQPVAVMPPGGGGSLSRGPIACAVSLGDDEAAIRFAGALAAITGRRLVLASVFGAGDAAAIAAARARMAVAAESPRAAGQWSRADATDDDGTASTDVALRAGVLAERLLDLARDAKADVLVMASRAGGPVSHALLGPMTSRLWTAAPCPVVVVEA